MQKMAGIIEQMNSWVCHFSETVCGLLQTKEIFFCHCCDYHCAFEIKIVEADWNDSSNEPYSYDAPLHCAFRAHAASLSHSC